MASTLGSSADKENQPPSMASSAQAGTGLKRRAPDDLFEEPVLSRGRKRQNQGTDPLVHYGRHFGRTARAFCRIHTLLTNGVNRMMQIDLGRLDRKDMDPTEMIEHAVYERLLSLVPSLEERINMGSNDELMYIADMLNKGSSSARSSDTRSLKSAVIDWITPTNGSLSPPLTRNVKTGRGFHHSRTGELLCPVNLDWNDTKICRDLASGTLVPSGDLWPRFLFQGDAYDPENPWEGLLRSSLLVSAFKHVFTSPSSAMTGEAGSASNRSTKSSNAHIHGMRFVTVSSIAYIATQVRFALSSTATFSRTDTVTDSEYFYFLLIDLLDDPEEHEEVTSLLQWWNRQVFPTYISETRAIHKDSVIAKIKERCRLRQVPSTTHQQASIAATAGSASNIGFQVAPTCGPSSAAAT